jgi:hypothetical protein
MKVFIIVLALAIPTHGLFAQVIPVDRLLGPAQHFMHLKHVGASINSIETIAGMDSLPVSYLLHFSLQVLLFCRLQKK